MRINNECARRILIEVEQLSYGETITVANLQEKMEIFSIEDVLSIVTLFNREHYLVVIDKVSYDDNDVFRDHKIKCLTERGYKVLDQIRSDDVWNKIKNSIDNFDDLTIYSIIEIASRINTANYNKMLGLPETFDIVNLRY